MKPRLFKIRNIYTSQKPESLARDLHNQKEINNEQDQKNFNKNKRQDGNYKQLVNMFKQFIKTSSQTNNRINQPSSYQQFQKQPRDRMIMRPLKQGEFNQSQLKQWITQLFHSVTSTAFNMFSKKQLNYEQVKVYCSQNIIKNIVQSCRNHILTHKKFDIINKHIGNGVINYLGKKYPLTQSTEVNKKLQQRIKQIDNIQTLSNNYLANSQITFQYRQDQNYNDIIMLFLNQIMTKIDQQQAQQKSLYLWFEKYMSELFDKVVQQDFVNDKNRSFIRQLSLNPQKSQTTQQNSPSKLLNKNSTQKIKSNQQKQKYKNKVKQYTHYIIGRKIPENVPLYNKKEINSKNMVIKSPTILRILTKWCDQLWNKYEQPNYFSNRSQSTKLLKGQNINSLLAWMRTTLDQLLQQEKIKIQQYKEQINKNNNQMQANILYHQLSLGNQGSQHVPLLQRISGKFACKINKNVQSYTIGYLNKLIHGLMKASKIFYQRNGLKKYSFWPYAPNLLSFKIGDLLRCKFSSRQKEVLTIYEQLQTISKQCPQILKIVRIKNRLKSGTNDILINAKFMNKMTCQIQLAVNIKKTDFIQSSNMFQHYIYQIKRSNFGPISQLCCVWISLDQRSSIYDELILDESSKNIKFIHQCQLFNKKINMQVYKNSLICSKCNIAYFHNIYLYPHLKCNGCDYFICAKCNINEESLEKLKVKYFNKNVVNTVKKKIDKSQEIPEEGYCIFIQSNTAKVQYFKYVSGKFNKKKYLFGKTQKGKLYQIEKISKPKLLMQFRNKHLIFQAYLVQQNIITQSEIDDYLLLDFIKNCYQRQKQTISLMDRSLTHAMAFKILDIGTKSQKQNVKQLFLTDNILDKIPINPQQFPNLKWMTLSRNINISLNGIQKLYSLKKIILVSCQLQKIPQQIFKCKNLISFQCSSNYITQIPKQISQLTNIQFIDLQSNGLNYIDQQIGKCVNLKELSFQTNQLSSLPKSLSNLKKLQKLYIGINNLNQLPQQLGQLYNLKIFDCKNNFNITAIPTSFQKLKKLKVLNIEQTNISQIPQPLLSLKLNQLHATSVKQLKVSTQNALSTLSQLYLTQTNFKQYNIIQYLSSITVLSLMYCKIKSLPHYSKNLNNLIQLYLSNNQIEEINDDFLSGCINVQKMHVCYNNIKKINKFQKFKKLQQLLLNNNDLTQLDDNIFEDCINLRILNLSSNQLKFLPKSLSSCHKINQLRLQKNKLQHIFPQQYQIQLQQNQTTIWPYLDSFFCNYNNFSYIPKFLFRCKNIQMLQFHMSPLTQIPKQISNLQKLFFLNFSNTLIQTIPQQCTSIKSITQFYCSNSKLAKLPKHIIAWKNLQAFVVDGHEFEQIQCADWLWQKFENYSLQIGNLYIQLPKFLKTYKIQENRYVKMQNEYNQQYFNQEYNQEEENYYNKKQSNQILED